LKQVLAVILILFSLEFSPSNIYANHCNNFCLKDIRNSFNTCLKKHNLDYIDEVALRTVIAENSSKNHTKELNKIISSKFFLDTTKEMLHNYAGEIIKRCLELQRRGKSCNEEYKKSLESLKLRREQERERQKFIHSTY